MKILVYSMYSPPEITGIGKYNGEMIDFLSKKGHEVYFLTTMPFYPEWRVSDKYKWRFTFKKCSENIFIRRVWSYTPKNVSSLKRIFKEFTFHVNSLLILFIKRIMGYQPDLIIYIAPPFFLPTVTTFIYKKTKKIYHIQDFEVDAAAELKMLPGWLIQSLLKVEERIINKMQVVSTISEGMINKLRLKGFKGEVVFFPNWADTEKIYRLSKRSKWLHKHLKIDENKKLIVYSGNIGKKQGFEVLPETIKDICSNHSDIHFVILGEGVFKSDLKRMLNGINKEYFTIGGLVEKEMMNEMLNSSFIQLVIQKSEGADSFMPSKLTNILSAGVPAVVTAKKETGLHTLMHQYNCAVLVEDTSQGLTKGIRNLLNDNEVYKRISANAANYAHKFLSKKNILENFESRILKL